MAGQTKQVERAEKKRRRTPFGVGAGRYKLALPGHTEDWFKRKDFHLAWMNDDSMGMIQRALDAAYVFVSKKEFDEAGGQVGERNVGGGNTDTDSRVSRIVGTREDGSPMRAYLMKQPMHFHLEDLAMLEEENKAIDDAIYRQDPNALAGQSGKSTGEIARDGLYGKLEITPSSDG